MRKVIVAVVAVALVGGGVFLYVRGGPRAAQVASRTPAADPHRDVLSAHEAMLQASLQAPQGGTPCDTAYNALVAFKDEMERRRIPAPWTTFPERAPFVTACAALPAQSQLCLQPHYELEHKDVCGPIVKRLRSEEHDRLFYLFGTRRDDTWTTPPKK